MGAGGMLVTAWRWVCVSHQLQPAFLPMMLYPLLSAQVYLCVFTSLHTVHLLLKARLFISFLISHLWARTLRTVKRREKKKDSAKPASAYSLQRAGCFSSLIQKVKCWGKHYLSEVTIFVETYPPLLGFHVSGISSPCVWQSQYFHSVLQHFWLFQE